MDMEFEKVQDELSLVQVNTMAAQEHVGEIEHGIHTIKERSKNVMSDLPFQFLHKQVVIDLVYFCVMWLNAMNKVYQENIHCGKYSLNVIWISPTIARLYLDPM